MNRGPYLLLIIGGSIIALAIIYALVFGTFWQEAEVLFPLPWFQLTLIDLYLGFFLFAGWIWFREESAGKAIIWIVVLCLLGNLAACVYAILALAKSKGDWPSFWMGSAIDMKAHQ